MGGAAGCSGKPPLCLKLSALMLMLPASFIDFIVRSTFQVVLLRPFSQYKWYAFRHGRDTACK